VIVVDTSALMAILLKEAEAEACETVLSEADPVVMAAPTFVEAMVVASGRGIGTRMTSLLEPLGVKIWPFDEAAARRAADAHARWGRGVHPAKLNFGDTFAYELAQRLACPLLYVGDDFSQSDVRSALTA
jgi:ribonuclease VapC